MDDNIFFRNKNKRGGENDQCVALQTMRFYPLPRTDQTQGFTLLELLIVIVLLGALSVITLPSFLSQSAKSRGAEAKSGLGTLIRSQLSFNLEHGTFAGDLSDLDAQISGKFYLFHRATATPIALGDGVLMEARPLETGLKGYNSIILRNGGLYPSTMCESRNIIPAFTNVPNLMMNNQCSPAYRQVQ